MEKKNKKSFYVKNISQNRNHIKGYNIDFSHGAYSNDLGKTLHSRIIFNADWKLSPYAEDPIPMISAGNEIFIDFEMRNAKREKTHYTIPILGENEQ